MHCRYAAFPTISAARQRQHPVGAMMPNFGVRELAPAFSTADLSAVGSSPRLVAASKSGDESPHSEKSVRITVASSSS